jgi:hypothetical protein
LDQLIRIANTALTLGCLGFAIAYGRPIHRRLGYACLVGWLLSCAKARVLPHALNAEFNALIDTGLLIVALLLAEREKWQVNIWSVSIIVLLTMDVLIQLAPFLNLPVPPFRQMLTYAATGIGIFLLLLAASIVDKREREAAELKFYPEDGLRL